MNTNVTLMPSIGFAVSENGLTTATAWQNGSLTISQYNNDGTETNITLDKATVLEMLQVLESPRVFFNLTH